MDAWGPTIRLGGRRLPAFRVLGVCGFAASLAIALGVAAANRLSVLDEAVIIAASVATFFTVTIGTKALTGRELLIYYHHEIAVLTVAGLVAFALGAPIRGHLDATALGLGGFLVCGRLGCLRAGCCHGRPAVGAASVRYGPAHVAAGLPRYLAGVPLVPVQAIEAGLALALVTAGIAVAVSGAAPGTAFGLYVTGYAACRFGLETLRGDAVRRYWHGLSEAQWTSLLVAGGAAVAAVAGAQPDPAGHVAAAVALWLAAPSMARRGVAGLLDPRHVVEVVGRLPVAGSGAIAVAETSGGVRLSASRADGRALYTVSRRPTALTDEDAQRLAALILWARHPGAAAELVPGAAGGYHVVVADSGPG